MHTQVSTSKPGETRIGLIDCVMINILVVMLDYNVARQ